MLVAEKFLEIILIARKIRNTEAMSAALQFIPHTSEQAKIQVLAEELHDQPVPLQALPDQSDHLSAPRRTG